MGPTAAICTFVDDTTLSDIPDEVLTHSKQMLIDTTGVSIAARCTEAVENACSAMDTADSGRGHVIGMSEQVEPTKAAFLNGLMAHALDFDDYSYGRGHTSACIFPGALAVAERENSSGEDLLLSFVVANEVHLAIGNAMNPTLYESGWHQTSVLGHIGTAIAAGNLLGLGQDELRSAIGIAASRASGLRGNFGTMTKPYHVGNTARGGVEAAMLAATGFDANKNVLNLEVDGFADVFAPGSVEPLGTALSDLGEHWNITTPKRVAFKKYPACASTHAAIDAGLAIQNSEDYSPGEIENVEIIQHPNRLHHTDCPAPNDGTDAKFSVQYCVATALATGDLWIDDFHDDAVDQPQRQRVLERTFTTPKSDVQHERGAEVTVRLADGSTFGSVVNAPSGTEGDPMTTQEITEKFNRCSEGLLSPNDQEYCLRFFNRLEEQDGMGELLAVLTADAGGCP